MTESADLVPLADRPHTLYRMFDSERRLLYVGIACDAQSRWRSHAEEKNWWWQVASVGVEHFSTRRAAMRAEQAAIRDELPEHNVQHKVRAPVTSSRPTHTPLRNVRIEDAVWLKSKEIAAARGESLTDVIKDALRQYNARHGHLVETGE